MDRVAPAPDSRPQLSLGSCQLGPVTKREARSLVKRVINDLSDAMLCIDRLWVGQAWTVLGYSSWVEMCEVEFAGLRDLSSTDRGKMIKSMSDQGLSTRAQAAVLGVDHSTISRGRQVLHDATPADQVTGVDGKTYTRQPARKIKNSTRQGQPEPIKRLDPVDVAIEKINTSLNVINGTTMAASSNPGVTDWSERVQSVTAELIEEDSESAVYPIDQLTDDEVSWLGGEAEHLLHCCVATLIGREKDRSLAGES